ncbi:MAG: type II toxin-antitoxin system RelB/DinJ family antitoxin [Rickettsiales bacterium]|nr:type II toxin-antitoxin system RelB/DinJ family antitoxin [Rickettsiales bacterium]
MAKTAVINVRVEPKAKNKAEKILAKVGLSISEAVNMFIAQVNNHNGLPFEGKVPNKRLRKTIEEIEVGKGLIRVNNVEEMFKQLEA